VKVPFLILFGMSSLFASAEVVKVDERFNNSQDCKACHLRIVKEWEKSWHSKSHYNNDEYFRKSLEYVARKTRKSLNSVKVKCATCHNPRIAITETDEDYEIAAVMGLNKNSKVDKAVNDSSIGEGINCVVCHNIDKIHDEYDESQRGINRVEWTASGIMTGPFNDAKSPYHEVVHHDFMDKKPNDLCFVCHANDRSVNGLVFTNMLQEYKKSDAKSCVECHMGEKREDVAATYKMYGGEAKLRDVREHTFEGAHTTSMWKDALELEVSQKGDSILLKISNPQPHNIPSGFGSREILVSVISKKSNKIIGRQNISLTNHYTRKKKKVTIPHLAKKQISNATIPANGKKVLKIKKLDGADEIEVRLNYILVNEEVRSLLKLKEPRWSKKQFITSGKLKF